MRAPGRVYCSFTAGRGWTSGTWTSWRKISATGSSIAAYQQRGLAPSTTEGPFEVTREVADAVAVLDALDWDRAWVVGHSWGGHLLLHLMVAAPQRLQGGLAIDPLGGVGDGGVAIFEAQILARTPEEDRRRAEELDARAMAGEGTGEESMESMRLVWPAYFASPDNVPPFPQFADSIPAYSGNWASLKAELPRLEAALPEITIPFGCVAGRAEPDAHRARRRADRSCDPGRLARSRRRCRAPPLVRTPWLRPPGPAAPDRLLIVLTVASVRLGRSWTLPRPRRAAPGTPPP